MYVRGETADTLFASAREFPVPSRPTEPKVKNGRRI
jgi:hypothetical protein